MAAKCALKPCVKNKEGKMVESKLFNGLLSALSSRAKAWKHYSIATNPEFLHTLNHVELDEYGELTLESYANAVHLDVQDSIIRDINRQLQSDKVLPFMDASNKMNAFNRSNTEHPGYMATIVKHKNGYTVQAVKRTQQAENELKSIVKNQTIQNKLIYHLNKAGVSVRFLQAGNSRYSTENATQTVKGLYDLIDWLQSNGVQELSEEAGHFVVGATRGTPLNDRFLQLVEKLDKEDALPIDKKKLKDKYIEEDAVGEYAGMMVGEAINKNLQGPIRTLAHRLCMSIKHLISKIDRNQLRNEIREAEFLAEDLARSFIDGSLNGNVENALTHLETFYSATRKDIRTGQKELIQQVEKLIEQLDTADSELSGSFKQILAEIYPHIKDDQAVWASTGFVTVVAALTKELERVLNSRQLTDLTLNAAVNSTDIVKQARHIRELEMIETALTQFVSLIDNVYWSNTQALDEAVIPGVGVDTMTGMTYGISSNFSTHLETLKEMQGTLSNYLSKNRAEVVAWHLTSLFGEQYVNHALGILWKGTDSSLRTLDIRTIMDSGRDHFSWIGEKLGSLSTSPDVMAQLYDKAIKQANYDAHKMTEKDYARALYLKKKAKEAGITDMSIFFEKDEKGRITNSLITDVRIGTGHGIESHYVSWQKYEEEYDQQMKEWDKEFSETEEGKELLKNNAPTTLYKLAFNHWLETSGKKKEWHNQNSIFDSAKNCWAPNPNIEKYKLDVHFTQEQEHWFTLYRDFLNEINDRMDNRMPAHRAPQFRATFTNRVKNIWNNSNVLLKPAAPIAAIWRGLVMSLSSENDPEAYGSIIDYLTKFKRSNTAFTTEDPLKRLPFYGINKIKKPYKYLSTDLITSTIAYASIVNKNVANRQVVDLLEVGLAYRRKGEYYIKDEFGDIKFDDSGNKMRPEHATRQLSNYIDKHIYGIGVRRLKLVDMALNGLSRLSTATAALIYLGGNPKGGAVNAAIGLSEIFKEASVGADIEMEYLWKAFGAYAAQIPGAIADWITQEDQHKVCLFAQKFRLLGENEYKYANRDSKTGQVLSALVSGALMGPYSIGEHFMQIVPVMAAAMQEKVITAEGEEISLWDALTVQDTEYIDYAEGMSILLDPEPINTGIKKLDYKSTLFTSHENRENYLELTEELELLKQQASLNVDHLSELAQRVLQQKGISLTDLRNDSTYISLKQVVDILEKHTEELTYDHHARQDFEDRARQITNLMHGVYNSLDKPTLSREAYGGMMLSMKGYLLGIVEKRYGRNKYSVALGRQFEGSHVTFWKTLNRLLKNHYDKQGNNVELQQYKPEGSKRGWRTWQSWQTILYLSTIGMFSRKGRNTKLSNIGLEQYQIDNIHRFNSDIWSVICWALMTMVTKLGDDDDDKKDNSILGFLYYLSVRCKWDQSVFLNPKVAATEGANIFTIIAPAISALYQLGDILYYTGGAIYNRNNYILEDTKSGQQRKIPKEGTNYKKFYYTEGEDAGTPKVYKKIQKIIPWYKEFNGKSYYKKADDWMHYQDEKL